MNYEIDGDQKWLIRDGKRFASSEATDCEMELWAALQAAYSAGAEQMRERSAQLCEGAPLPEGYDQNDTAFHLAKAIRALPIGAPQEKP